MKIQSKCGEVSSDRVGVIPPPESFRVWLAGSLVRLGLKAGGYGPELGLGKNTLGHFLAGPDRDLRLGTAAMISNDLMARAQEAGTALDPIPSAVSGGDDA